MVDYTAIAIGINRYQFIQPLSYAQADAQALHQILLEEIGLPQTQSLILTDASPWVGEHSTAPTQEVIQYWMEQGLEQPPTSVLLFFFSGYGVNWEGVDYLMPMDGNPADIENTGIAAQSLFESLQRKGFRHIVALLDINRSPGVIAGKPVGSQLAQIAPEMGVSLLLSCQVDESSHEAVALGHGIFTAALLEALRYYGQEITLHDLSSYLYERLPEVSEHHWRPIQHPLIIIPSLDVAQQSLLPSRAMVASASASTGEQGAIATPPQTPPKAEAVTPLEQPETPPPSPAEPEEALGAAGVPASGIKKTPQWQKWIFWVGGAAILLVILAIFWTGRETVLQNGNGEETTGEVAEGPPETPSEPAPEPAPEAEIPAPEPTPVAPQSPAPTPEPSPVPQTLQESQAILARARTYIQTNQASGFSRAIAEAKRIPPGAPLYDEAQGDIARWSGVILDLARGRANQGQFDSAIAAARLVPAEPSTTYQTAQQSIQQWTQQKEQQAKNQEIISSARRMIRYTQASSYSRGISTLRAVPQGEPGYPLAQDLIERWSRQIYLIANSRAARGNFSQAVETARLVPAGTPSHEPAQKAIERWQRGQR
ncbi:caspase family protein [Spirulina subsalsa]|uniref:caspase family protein n=1 Tax=Spirulina subsalsa TaxID=54311 RepID=UPI0002FD5537|nr:caspase family protein [Spirulina subsalsa]